jgi:hypothetical protein
MRYAELTGSRIKPPPLHSPWSGGSNFWLKLVTWLSRLLTPLKLTRAELVAVAAAAADADVGAIALGTASAAEKWLDDGRRTPLGTIRDADGAPTAGLCLGTSRATPDVPV